MAYSVFDNLNRSWYLPDSLTKTRLTKPFAFLFLFSVLALPTWGQGESPSGDIAGVVTDETGETVIGATIYLDGTDLGALTDTDGSYLIPNIPPGSYNLVVSYVGYETQTMYNVIVKSRGTPNYDFVLEASATELGEVVVTTKNTIGRQRETPLSTQTLSAVEIATYPGSNNDVVQVAQTLPGVSPSIGGFRNDLVIRGGAANETVYYLDGIEVPNINHFSTQGSSGGPVGMVNVSFVDNVTLSASAFGTQYDNPLSGVLQFKQRKGNDRHFNGNFRISASEAALTMEGPLFKRGKEKSNTTVLASVRRSYLEFLFGLIGLPFRPNYWDYQYKIHHRLNDYNEVSLIGLGSIDDFSVEAPADFSPEQQAQLEQAPFIEQRTNTIGLQWRKRFKDGRGFIETALSHNLLKNVFSRYDNPEEETGLLFRNDAREAETKLRYQYTRFAQGWTLKAGFNLQHSFYDNSTQNPIANMNFDSEIVFLKYGWFANATRSFFGDKLDVNVGFRMDGDSFTEGSNLAETFSPRLALSYQFAEDWRVNGSVGRYFKLPPYTILGFRNNAGELVNKDVPYTKSDHYVLGVEHYFSPSSNIAIEGFYKKYGDYPISLTDGVSLANKGAGFEVLGSESIVSDGKGRSYGAELQFQQKLYKRFYGIFAYTWFYSEFTGLDGKYRPSVWDSRHLVSFVGGYKLPRNWEISARYRFAGHSPYAPTDLEATLRNYPETVLDYDRLGDEKLAAFSQLDVRIDKKWNFKKLSLNVFFEVQNLLFQDSPQPPQYGLDRDDTGAIVTPISLVPIPESEGQLIPSFGVVVDF